MFEQLQEKPHNRTLKHRWWFSSSRAVFALLLAGATILVPGAPVATIVILLGAYALVDGAWTLCVGTLIRWPLWVLAGAIGVVAGGVALQHPDAKTATVLSVAAAWALLRGVTDAAGSMALRREIPDEWSLLAAAVVSILFGVLAIVFPTTDAIVVAKMIGIYALIEAVMVLQLTIRLFRFECAGRQPKQA
ncbi:MAG: DUF308 domain-containing protein [Thermoanaerobaculia bacterium]|nr:DUF308 domain-containing protein [Thermoanaerobaculia bacterium]